MNEKNVLPKVNVKIEIDIPSNIEFDSVPDPVVMLQTFSTPDEAVQVFKELRSLILEKLDLDSLDDAVT